MGTKVIIVIKINYYAKSGESRNLGQSIEVKSFRISCGHRPPVHEGNIEFFRHFKDISMVPSICQIVNVEYTGYV